MVHYSGSVWYRIQAYVQTKATLSTKTFLLIATLLHSDTGRGFELPETLCFIEQIRPDDQLPSIRTNSTALM
jgi:hypothetical protein